MSPRGPEDTAEDPADAGGFLRGWSRRKLAARREEARLAEGQGVASDDGPQDDGPEDARPVDASPEDAQASEAPDAEEIDLSDLPAVDEITEATDIRPFMRRGVPAPLRAAALRRAWSLSRHAREYTDPAVDYAWDWNAPGGVPGGGGTLDPGAVRRMVSDIFGRTKPESTAQPQDLVEDRPAPLAARDATDLNDPKGPRPPETTDVSQAGGDAEPGPDPAAPAEAAPAPPEAAAATPEASDAAPKAREMSMPARRHGSARPTFDDGT